MRTMSVPRPTTLAEPLRKSHSAQHHNHWMRSVDGKITVEGHAKNCHEEFTEELSNNCTTKHRVRKLQSMSPSPPS